MKKICRELKLSDNGRLKDKIINRILRNINPHKERALRDAQIVREERILNAVDFSLRWIEQRHGSAAEYVKELCETFGLEIQSDIVEIVDRIKTNNGLLFILREYVESNLTFEKLCEAIEGRHVRHQEERSTLDELFERSHKLKTTDKYAEAINFIAKIRKYKPFNNMLVYLQNPESSFYATANYWKKNSTVTSKKTLAQCLFWHRCILC